MNKYKVQLHCHSKSDPEDWLFHSNFKLIDRAKHYNYDVLAITCHNKIVHNDQIEEYARKKDILLIPGIEKTISNKHVLIVNATKEAQQLQNFADLREYRKRNPQSLIVAPHPYHPLPISIMSLNKNLEENLDLFDALEWSCFYTKMFNFNKKAAEKAKEFGLPLLGTADNHILKYLNYTFSYVRAPQKTKKDIIDNIRKGNIEIETKPINFFMLGGMTVRLTLLELTKRLFRKVRARK